MRTVSSGILGSPSRPPTATKSVCIARPSRTSPQLPALCAPPFPRPDLAYSAGVRQGLLALFGNSTRADLSINKGGGSQRMLRSRFCFTPMGFGWGIRLSQAMLTGCVPIMVHDHVWPVGGCAGLVGARMQAIACVVRGAWREREAGSG